MKIINGNALETIPTLHKINSVVTSPPYYGLRHYGEYSLEWPTTEYCEHEWIEYKSKGISGGTKSKKVKVKDTINYSIVEPGNYAFCNRCGAWFGELGQEPTITLYIKHLVQIFHEAYKVLDDTGICWVNIGDTYAGSGGAGGDWTKGKRSEAQKWCQQQDEIEDKSLMLIPFKFQEAMVADGWIFSAMDIWEKPNVMPSSAYDRPTTNYEFWFAFTKQKISIPSEVLKIPTGQNKYKHFATYNINVCRKPISYATGTVLDPFCGSGTTGIEAVKQRKDFIGIEINKEYVGIAYEYISSSVPIISSGITDI